ncbi:preprotein translocase subunit YajC [Sinobacterium caligoides]|uniref:Sec translocon accessory complex subunit YajC n=1 Tax=Sinobacterium caligoides TaxID=933926 RepID=A0A3N2DYN6_9GAMM|nr:preprotein translocase subunit YajC [Sinobacterium caligoides]ROS04629.1 preprotein translocase subunit YajC [Sinobacterium caligoides]
MSFLIPSAYAQDAAAAAPGFDPIQLVFMGGLFVVFYFIAIRPQRKRQKEHTSMMNELAKGDEVMTTGGMLGKIVSLDEGYVVLKVSDNVELKFQKSSVHAVLPKGTLKKI